MENWQKKGKGIYYYNVEIDMKESGEMIKEKEKLYIIYYNNGEREMKDYLNDLPIGKHVKLNINGIISPINY